MALEDLFPTATTKAPEFTYFDHLYNEYLTFETDINDTAVQNTVKRLHEKRQERILSWNDIYFFELVLASARPVASLRSKILSLRSDYRAVVGQVKYDEYMASKPTVLQTPPDPEDPPNATAPMLIEQMREDLKDLLGRLYLQYSILPVREARLKRLTIWTAVLSGIFLVVLIIFVITMYFSADTGFSVPSLTLFVVICAGAMGGFVSALQRSQASTNEGDTVYNLSMLYHGSYAVFVAPLTGAVFSMLLYFMFVGGVLEGRFFPKMYTPPARLVQPVAPPAPTPATTPTPAASPTPTPSPTPAPGRTPATRRGGAAIVNNVNANNANANNANNTNNTNTNTAANTNTNVNNTNTAIAAGNNNLATPSPTERPAPAATPEQVPTESIGIKRFLGDSGPAGGADYALLLIWSFIAGFAERFVPDALNRLVAGRQMDNKTKS